MNVRIFDNRGDSVQRYTIAYMDNVNEEYQTVEMLSLSDLPSGKAYHGEVSLRWINSATKSAIEIPLTAMPVSCQRVVRRDIEAFKRGDTYRRPRT